MRTIAIEEHFLAKGFREVLQSNASSPAGVLNPMMTAERQTKLADLDTLRLQDMDTSGIDLQVISDMGATIAPRPGDEGVQLAREANDQLAQACATHPDRFAGFATLPMTQPEAAADELERAVRSLGLKGAMLFGTTNGRFLDDPAFLPVLERAVALSVPIYLHPAFPPAPVREAYYTNLDPAVGIGLATFGWGWHSEVGMHALRLILAGVFDRLPTLQIIIGHMGEMIPFMLARIQDMLTPVAKQLQQPMPEYFLHNFYITTSGFFTDPPLLLALQVVGAERIIFSVDYPFSANEQGRAFLDHASISPADKEKISHLNAERLLGLEQA
ncbi:MAG: amidohydrolase family protein [Ktedonobacteraceae bacterium]